MKKQDKERIQQILNHVQDLMVEIESIINDEKENDITKPFNSQKVKPWGEDNE